MRTKKSNEETTEKEREAVIDLLRLMNQEGGINDLIRNVTVFMQAWSGCEAVGVRLRDGPDFPYFETRGFPEEHVKLENRLCAVDQGGELIRDSEGNPVLECMCGNVLCGRFDATLPFFTQSGSFWTNSTSDLLASTSEADRQARTRNRCHGEGYESVLLAPITNGSRTLGLLQLNDSRKNIFTPDLVGTIERLASNLYIGLMQREQAQRLRDQEQELSAVYSHIPQSALLLDSESRIRSVNSAGTAMAGSSAEELRGKRAGEVMRCRHHLDEPRGCGFAPECEKCAINNTVLTTLRTGENFFQVEATQPVLHDGVCEEFAFFVATSLLWIKEEPCVLVTLENITERMRMEMALRRKEDELAMLLDHIPVQVYYFVDPGTYGAVNQAHADFLGMQKIDIEYNRLENVLSPELAFACREGNEKIFATTRPQHTFTWAQDCRGKWRQFLITKVPCTDVSGNKKYIVCSAKESPIH